MAGRGLVEEARALYALPPAEFVAARDARRAELRDSDRPLADELGRLRRAAPAAWLVTVLVSERPELVETLVDLGDELRTALEGGDRAALAELTTRRRALLREASDLGRGLAAEHGVSAGTGVLDAVAETLQAAMGDPAAADAVRSGLLVRALEPSGFDPVDLSDALAVEDGEPAEPERRPRLRRVDDPDAELARARREADEALADATRRLAAAREAQSDHERRTAEAEGRRDELAADVERLEEELTAVRRALAQAERRAREVRGEAIRVERERENAEDAVARATERRARFDGPG